MFVRAFWPFVEKWTALFSAHGIIPLAKFLCVLLAESLFCPLSSISLGLLFCKITALLYQFDVVSLISVLHWSDRFGSLQSVVPLQPDASSLSCFIRPSAIAGIVHVRLAHYCSYMCM